MSRIIVEIPGAHSYEIHIEELIVSTLGRKLRGIDPMNSHVVIITDEVVGPLYVDRAKTALRDANYHVDVLTIPVGPTSNSPECVAELWSALARLNCDANTIVLAIGGSVICDLAGFVASTFKQGVRLVLVPTTLKSMVTCSVGGKTSLTIAEGDTFVGTIHHPSHVCLDVALLSTLPDSNWTSGCAELVRNAVIDSDDFFFWFDANSEPLARRVPGFVIEALRRSVALKARIAVADCRSSKGMLQALMYGSTLAGALGSYDGLDVSEGERLAQGMRFAARLGAAIAQTPVDFVFAQDALLDSLGLPALQKVVEPERVLQLMKEEAGAQGESVRFVLPTDIGKCKVMAVKDEVILEHLTAWQSTVGEP